uniref:Secreted protein n=1 Tax=Bursaphelenchus xylophilus TaxID=6326 RepID=A0A1I7SCE3_BURXY
MSAARKCRLPASVPGCPQVSQLPANVSAARKCDPPNFARKVVARKKFARKLVARKVVARKCRDAIPGAAQATRLKLACVAAILPSAKTKKG